MADDLKKSYMIIVNQNWAVNRLSNKCRRVMIKALPGNADTVWMSIDNPAKANFSFPIEPGDSVTFPLERLDQLNFLFTVSTDTLAVIYSVVK